MAKEEGKDKKPEEKKATDNWGKDFKGKVVYNKDGVRVLQSADNSIPFKVVLLADGTKKVLPPKADITKIDVTTLPDLDEKNLDKNVTASQLYGTPKIDEKVMTDWNGMTTYLKDKGYAGDPKMNNVEYSKKVFDQYKKDNPESSLTYEHVLPVQILMHQYRNQSLDKINKGETKVVGDIAPDGSNFMSHAATDLGKKEDGILGQETSTFVIPSSFKDTIAPENRIGFAATPEGEQATPQVPPQQVMQSGQGLYYGGRRVAEMFQREGQPTTIKWRNDMGSLGTETQIPHEDLQKYVGTTNAFQSNELYKSLLSKATSTAKK